LPRASRASAHACALHQVSEFTIDYTDCRNAGSEYVAVPSGKYDYQLPGSTPSNFQAPQWRWVASNTAPNGFVCDVQFSVPQNLEPSVFLYYKLTNYYQNHRRYVKSIDTDQLLGKERTVKDLGDGQCKPLGREGDRGIWPCGLIANSMFNGEWRVSEVKVVGLTQACRHVLAARAGRWWCLEPDVPDDRQGHRVAGREEQVRRHADAARPARAAAVLARQLHERARRLQLPQRLHGGQHLQPVRG
jgi:hypothetical protein